MVETNLFAFPNFAQVAEVLIGIAGAASNVAKKNSTLETLTTIGLRFSPNSRLTTEMPVLRPVLVALQLAQLDTETKCLLAVSLSEAESLRWALEKFDTQTELSFCLHIISDSCDSVNKAPWLKSSHPQSKIFMVTSIRNHSSIRCFSSRFSKTTHSGYLFKLSG